MQVAGENGSEDEFVEIYNKGNCAVDFGEYKLRYLAASNNGGGGAGFTGSLTIPAGAYAVLGTEKFTGPKQATMSSGLAATGGQLAIVRKDNSNLIIDGVAWGTVSNGTFTEGQSCTKPGNGQSIQRVPNGVDTNNNRDDFEPATPTPGAANQP